MQSTVEVNENDLKTLIRRSEIFDSIVMLMEEAADRADSAQAVTVVSTILGDLSNDYPELHKLARSWALLAVFDKSEVAGVGDAPVKI